MFCRFVPAIKRNTKTNIMTTILTNNWNRLERAKKLEIIENAIDMANTNEGFLMLRLYSKDNSIYAYQTREKKPKKLLTPF